MVRGSFGTCQKIQTGWSQPFPSQEVQLGWLMQKVVGTSNALHLKSCTKPKQDNTVKTLTIYFWKTLLAVVLPRNRIFLIQTKVITIIIPSIASSQLGSHLPPLLSWKIWKDIKKRFLVVWGFCLFNLRSLFIFKVIYFIFILKVIVYPRFSQPQPYWHLGLDNSL